MRIILRMTSVLAVCLLLTATNVLAQPLEFGIDDDKGQSIVKVTSNNPLQTMEHSTSSVTGSVMIDPADVKGSAKAYFLVNAADLSSHSTFWAGRDKLMHSTYLQSEEYPEASFTLTEIVSASSKELTSFTPVEIVAKGNFTLHGVTQPIEVKATVIYMKESMETQARGPGHLLRVNANWSFNLSDYKIQVPRKGPLAFDEEQKMTLEVFASTAKDPVMPVAPGAN